MEPHYRKRRVAESFPINKRAKAVNVLNRNGGVVLPSIYSLLLDKKNILAVYLFKFQNFYHCYYLFLVKIFVSFALFHVFLFRRKKNYFQNL